MLRVDANTKDGSIKITSYNGNCMQKEVSQIEDYTKMSFYPKTWNFFREENNHAYVGGSIFYGDDCENNLIISPYLITKLVGVQNAFVFVGDSFIEVSPISDISNAIDKGKRKLSNQEINYHIPESAFKRENLIKKDLNNLKQMLMEIYGIAGKQISQIPSRNKLGGVYYIESNYKQKYVLKYKSCSKEYAELLSQITNSIPNLFPKVYPKLNENGYSFKMGGAWYNLESFIEGDTRERNLNYFAEVGKFMGELHKELSLFSKNNNPLNEILNSKDRDLSQSNIASAYLDLSIMDKKHGFLISELENMIKTNFSSKIDKLHSFLIHKDLNNSNIVWEGQRPKIIDSESIKISKRINEFIPALILKGNRNRPNYVSGSLSKMINSYNASIENALSEEEIRMLPILLKYSLIKYYTIRNIRRGIRDELSQQELEKEITKIDREI